MKQTRIVTVDPASRELAGSEDLARSLSRGAVAAYPTETFYALGAAAFSKTAVDKIFRLKKRDAAKPLSFVVSDMDMVDDLVAATPAPFPALAAGFWPGPLTLVLPAAARLPKHVLGPGGTIALRVPPLPWLRALVRDLGEPLTATSANLSGDRELSDAAEVKALFGGRVEIIVDGGRTPGGSPSTIVDLTGAAPRILREGRIPAARIEAVLRGAT